MIKYKTGDYGELISAVEVERETESFLWVNGRRRAKSSSYEKYFDTWDDAKAYLLQDAERSVEAQRRELKRGKSRLGNIKGLKKPDNAA